MQRSQLKGPVAGGDGVLGPQGPRAPAGHGLVQAAASRGNQETRGPASAGAGAGVGRVACHPLMVCFAFQEHRQPWT